MAESSRDTLSEFIRQVQTDLQSTVSIYLLFTAESLHSLNKEVQSAWNDLQEDFRTALDWFDRETDKESDDLLRAHGLTGPQLTFKIQAWKALTKGARERLEQVKSAILGVPRRISGPASAVLGVLRPAEPILESLASIGGIMGPIAGSVAEFKSMLESVAESSRESRAPRGEPVGAH